MPKTQYQKPTYPFEWTQIAYRTKQAAGWKCEDCGITQGVDPRNNITVHHDDHNTFNNNPSNLIVCCQICHLRREGKHRLVIMRERALNAQQASGQLVLPGFNPYPLTE